METTTLKVAIFHLTEKCTVSAGVSMEQVFVCGWGGRYWMMSSGLNTHDRETSNSN